MKAVAGAVLMDVDDLDDLDGTLSRSQLLPIKQNIDFKMRTDSIILYSTAFEESSWYATFLLTTFLSHYFLASISN